MIGHPKGAVTLPTPTPADQGSAKRGTGTARRAVLLAAALGVLCLILTACGTGPQDSLRPAGDYARRADNLLGKAMIIVVLVFVLVEGAIVMFLVKYRERPGAKAPVQIHGHTRAEVIWTIIPALILAGLAIPTVKLIFDFARVPPKADRIDVKVVGHQWWWEYQYPGLGEGGKAVITANEMHIPIKKPIFLSMESKDVIHSFWVPKLNGKTDVIPGHTNHMTIEADTPGTYWGQCSQYCGISHANMRLRVVAETPSDFQAWVAANAKPAQDPAPADAQAGRDLFLKGRNGSGFFAPKMQACSNCHAIGGTEAAGVLGPNLTHAASRQAFAGDILEWNDENLRRWLKDPPKEKPGSDMPNLGLTDPEITQLIAYLQTLH